MSGFTSPKIIQRVPHKLSAFPFISHSEFVINKNKRDKIFTLSTKSSHNINRSNILLTAAKTSVKMRYQSKINVTKIA